MQCLLGKNAVNSNVIKGSLDDAMAKIGNVLFRIEPNLPNGNRYIDMSKTWCVGMELSHRIGKPSVATLALSTAPLEGSLRSWHFTTHLNPAKKDVITLEANTTLMMKALEIAVSNVGAKALPTNIIVFRGGMPDNRLRELYSKEVVGLQRAINLFKEKYKRADWKVKLNYIVRCKGVLDRFGQIQSDHRTGNEFVGPIKAPAVIYDGVTSERLWDFYLWPYHPKKSESKTKPARYVVIKDEMKLADGGAFDLFQLVYALTYTYVFSIPFPLGPTASPGPLQYAKHYAERFSQMIFSSDRTIQDLNRSEELPNQPQLATPAINAPDENKREESGTT